MHECKVPLAHLQGSDEELAEGLDGAEELIQRELSRVFTQILSQITLPAVDVGETLVQSFTRRQVLLHKHRRNIRNTTKLERAAVFSVNVPRWSPRTAAWRPPAMRTLSSPRLSVSSEAVWFRPESSPDLHWKRIEKELMSWHALTRSQVISTISGFTIHGDIWSLQCSINTHTQDVHKSWSWSQVSSLWSRVESPVI